MMQVGLKLFCQNCDETGEQPFALSKSSGIELVIETAAPQTGSSFVGMQPARHQHNSIIPLTSHMPMCQHNQASTHAAT